MRCVKAKRPCSGYEEDDFSAFRQYGPDACYGQAVSFPLTARKCRLPKRTPIPGSDVIPQDDIPPEISDAQSNNLALRAFFYDYCMASAHLELSRGYLSGLETAVHRLGPESDLVKACIAVSFASHSKPLNRPTMLLKAESFYQQLLGSLAKAIVHRSSGAAAEIRLVAMLLGLYQVRARERS
jgi:hypothetical protein